MAKDDVAFPNPPVEEISPPPISYDIPNFESGQQKTETPPAQEETLQIPVTDPSLVEQQVVAMFDARVKENQMKGNAARTAKKDEHLQKIMMFAQEKRSITNEQVRELLHVSQSTATAYLQTLVSGGQLRVDGKAKNTVYLY